ncbi:hypothetical protein EDC01DRAFT_776917 [Geopyxis carbonaria]|nr:hypothetical protein EDC01DRAFT_776917 [Geopyxis carbonaria]
MPRYKVQSCAAGPQYLAWHIITYHPRPTIVAIAVTIHPNIPPPPQHHFRATNSNRKRPRRPVPPPPPEATHPASPSRRRCPFYRRRNKSNSDPRPYLEQQALQDSAAWRAPRIDSSQHQCVHSALRRCHRFSPRSFTLRGIFRSWRRRQTRTREIRLTSDACSVSLPALRRSTRNGGHGTAPYESRGHGTAPHRTNPAAGHGTAPYESPRPRHGTAPYESRGHGTAPHRTSPAATARHGTVRIPRSLNYDLGP